MSFAPPSQFDEYRLVRPLGRGAMGHVYLGHDSLLDRPVAIKFIAAVQPGKLARERFLVEARAIARLVHPNVVSIHRMGVVKGWPYLVSELVDGEGLDRLARPVPEAAALRIARGLARGLAAAHRRGVLHRDLKPANVVVTREGEAKLLDFGLAKLLDVEAPPPELVAGTPPPGDDLEATAPRAPDGVLATRMPGARGAERLPALALTCSGDLMGTPRYLAPELWLGGKATARTDLYSLGVVLYELVAARPPHAAPTFAALREAVLTREPTPLAEAAPAISAGLAAIVDRCVQRNPEQRFGDADQLLAALDELAAGPPRAQDPARGPLRWLAPACLLAVAAGATWVGSRELHASAPTPAPAIDAGPSEPDAGEPPPDASPAPVAVAVPERRASRRKPARRVEAPPPPPAPDDNDAAEQRLRRWQLRD